VLHLGCTDWPYTQQKLAGGALLHALIADRAASLVGVDADAEGVAWLQGHGFPHTHVDNVEGFTQPAVLEAKYDVILAGEILEHLENPGRFLRSVQRLMGPGTDLIVTTINAYCLFRFVYYVFKGEQVHPDHNYYFSPLVLAKLVSRCGLEVVESLHYPIGREIRRLNPRKIVWLDDLSRLLFPRASDGLILKARLASRP
jgi:cyclopropane fatty-acyl-phospholipid synthase-like methyltransferase